MKLPTRLSLMVSALLGCSFAGAGAATISVNFTADDIAMAATDEAGAPEVRAANWNNVPAGTAGAAAGLIDSDGSTTGAAIAFTSTLGGWRLSSLAAGAQDDLMWHGYLDADGTASTVTFTGLDSSTPYNVYVYFDGDNGGDWRVANFTIGATSLGGEDSEGTNWGEGQNVGKFYQQPIAGDGGNQPFTGTDATNNNEGNYVVFEGVTGDTFTLESFGSGGAGTLRAPINGIQIVPIPEPSSALLALLGSAFFLRRRR